jgi:hypothetical protein
MLLKIILRIAIIIIAVMLILTIADFIIGKFKNKK